MKLQNKLGRFLTAAGNFITAAGKFLTAAEEKKKFYFIITLPPSLNILSLYEKGKKFWELGTKGEKKMAAELKEYQPLFFSFFPLRLSGYIYILSFQVI